MWSKNKALEKDDDRPFVDYQSTNNIEDIEKDFAEGGSLAIEILDCDNPECQGKCCTTYADLDEFRDICGADIWDYNSDDFGHMHMIPKFWEVVQ